LSSCLSLPLTSIKVYKNHVNKGICSIPCLRSFIFIYWNQVYFGGIYRGI